MDCSEIRKIRFRRNKSEIWNSRLVRSIRDKNANLTTISNYEEKERLGYEPEGELC